MLYYFDSSAWIKRYYDEQGTSIIESIFQMGEILACSTFGMVEITGVLSRKCKAKTISAKKALNLYSRIEEDWANFFQIQVSEEIIESAKRFAQTLSLKGADAIHLSTVYFLKGKFFNKYGRPILVTSDHELIKAADFLDIVVIDPEKNGQE